MAEPATRLVYPMQWRMQCRLAVYANNGKGRPAFAGRPFFRREFSAVPPQQAALPRLSGMQPAPPA